MWASLKLNSLQLFKQHQIQTSHQIQMKHLFPNNSSCCGLAVALKKPSTGFIVFKLRTSCEVCISVWTNLLCITYSHKDSALLKTHWPEQPAASSSIITAIWHQTPRQSKTVPAIALEISVMYEFSNLAWPSQDVMQFEIACHRTKVPHWYKHVIWKNIMSIDADQWSFLNFLP